MAEPTWITEARSLIGTRETPGPASNPKLMGWAKKLGSKLGITYTGDDVPWCGLFVANCINNAGLTPAGIAVRASSWATWGFALAHGALGAVLVFKRPGGGHVGFYVGEDATHYHVLGGNQGDAVNISRIEKARCVAIRWPVASTAKPGAPVILARTTAATSVSEA